MNIDRTHMDDDLIGDWLEEGPTSAPDHVLALVLTAIPSTSQRRSVRRVPWRFLPVNGYARVLAVAATAVVAAVAGLIMLNTPPATRVAGSPAPPVQTATAPASPAPTATPLDTTGWTLFESTRNGLSVRYPTGWTVTAATAPWRAGTDHPDPPNPVLDVVSLPTNGDMTLTLASQPVPRGTTPTAWLTAYEHKYASFYADMPQCFPAPAAMQRMAVGGQSAWVHGGCGFSEAIAFVGGRVYVLTWLGGDFGTDMFDALLSTVRFTPASANDAPAATGCPGTGVLPSCATLIPSP